MLEVPRRLQQVVVALPATLTQDIPHLREKTGRLGFILRALAIFRVEKVIVYLDQDNNKARLEAKLMEKILKFQETPPYLRKQIFPPDRDFAYTGTLPPLRTPHHPDRTGPTRGLLREAIAISSGPISNVDAGFSSPVIVRERLESGKRYTIRISTPGQTPEAEIVDRAGLPIYWGPEVRRDDRPLNLIMKESDRDLTISTSRQGTDIREIMDPLRSAWRTSRRPLVIFGSPTEGIPEILARSGPKIPEADFNINTVPDQGVETVRTEEALLSTLAVLNLFVEN
jgi:predicted SPOUT superfamily RNA methylase MTH1